MELAEEAASVPRRSCFPCGPGTLCSARMKTRWTLALLALFAISLQACSVSVPAVVRTRSGETFTGTTTPGVKLRTYSLASNEGRTLTGTFQPWERKGSRIFDFTISDGRTGRGTMQGVSDKSGHGMGRLSTGEDCRFMYGTAALGFE